MNSVPVSLDIVIPAHNEAETIMSMLSSLDAAVRLLHETFPDVKVAVIVVDSGSTDDTRKLVQAHGTPCAESPKRGRGNQIACGINQQSGEWILILHADSSIKSKALLELFNSLSERPEVGWGILGHDYDQAGLFFWLTRLINRWRFDARGLGYGDQGLFIKRAVLEEKGGFPQIPLMEDVEVSLMLKDEARIRIGEWLTASSRQWKKKGFWRYSIQNLRFSLAYVKGRKNGGSAEELASQLYRLYYGEPNE